MGVGTHACGNTCVWEHMRMGTHACKNARVNYMRVGTHACKNAHLHLDKHIFLLEQYNTGYRDYNNIGCWVNYEYVYNTEEPRFMAQVAG